MSLRTVMVYLDDSEHTPVLVNVAASLARQHGAHLTGLVPTGWIEIPGKPRPALEGSEYIPLTREGLRQRAEQVAAAFAQQAQALQIASWDTLIDQDDPTPSTLRNGRLADLLVIPKSDYTAKTPTVAWDFPPHIVMGTGRPVLVVPREGGVPGVGQRIVVAWNGSREAARALADALPLLGQAQAVQVASVQEPGSDEDAAQASLARLRAWFARHAIEADFARLPPAGDAGEALLACAGSFNADLLVMGAYGHSRFRELVLGGATRTVLGEASLPVLMSH